VNWDGTMTYLFHRDGGFYPVDIPPEQLAANIHCNPGTRAVSDAVTGHMIWTQAEGWMASASTREREGYVKK